MDETSSATDSSAGTPPLRVLIAYSDLVAGLRAMRVLTNVCQAMANPAQSQLLPWSFDLLAEPDWADIATREAVNADILLISTTGPRPLPPTILRWVQTTLKRKRGPAALVALHDPEVALGAAALASLEALENAAREAGITYIAPTPRPELETVLERIHRRGTITLPNRLANQHLSASPKQFTLQPS